MPLTAALVSWCVMWSVSSVAFYANGSLIATDTSSPYSLPTVTVR